MADYEPRIREVWAKEADYILRESAFTISDPKMRADMESLLAEARRRRKKHHARPVSERNPGDDGFPPGKSADRARAIGWDAWAENYRHMSMIATPGGSRSAIPFARMLARLSHRGTRRT